MRHPHALLLGAWLALGSLAPLEGQTPRPKPKEPVREHRPEAARTAPTMIEADLACSLTVDDEAVGQLAANEIRTFQLTPGQHMLRATSRDHPDIIWRKTIEVVSGQRRAVVIELKPLVNQYTIDEASRLNERRSRILAGILAARLEATRGSWTQSKEYVGTSSDGPGTHARSSRTLTITGEKSPLAARLVERTVYETGPDPAGAPRVFTREILATLNVSVSATDLTAQLVSLQTREGDAAFVPEPSATVKNFEFVSAADIPGFPFRLSMALGIAGGLDRVYVFTKQ